MRGSEERGREGSDEYEYGKVVKEERKKEEKRRDDLRKGNGCGVR